MEKFSSLTFPVGNVHRKKFGGPARKWNSIDLRQTIISDFQNVEKMSEELYSLMVPFFEKSYRDDHFCQVCRESPKFNEYRPSNIILNTYRRLTTAEFQTDDQMKFVYAICCAIELLTTSTFADNEDILVRTQKLERNLSMKIN